MGAKKKKGKTSDVKVLSDELRSADGLTVAHLPLLKQVLEHSLKQENSIDQTPQRAEDILNSFEPPTIPPDLQIIKLPASFKTATMEESKRQLTVEIDIKNMLVKVGPNDLSGVGGHKVRQEMIKYAVNEALKNKFESSMRAAGQHPPKYTSSFSKVKDGFAQPLTFEDVHVSACIGVRSNQQMWRGLRENTKDEHGESINAYIKTKGEKKLTLWKPSGPQRTEYLAMGTATSLFEWLVGKNKLTDSKHATKEVMNSGRLNDICGALKAHVVGPVTRLCKQIMDIVHNVEKFGCVQKKIAPSLFKNSIQEGRPSSRPKEDYVTRRGL